MVRLIAKHMLPTGCAMALALLCAGSARAQLHRAEPLDVPGTAVMRPEDAAQLPVSERIERAHRQLRERGYGDLPVLAWAALREADRAGKPELIERAVAMAPRTSSVRFEAARQLRSPSELIEALRTLRWSFPGLLWLATAGLSALGIGALLAASTLIAIGFGRSQSLHGHALGHFVAEADPPSWPGVLIALTFLAMIPLAGLGPACVLAAAGAMAAIRARVEMAVALAIAVTTLGIALGPMLGGWSRLAVVQGRDSAALMVWRVDRGQPLPGDRQRLERAVEREPEDLLLRLGVSGAAKREGDVRAARRVLSYLPDSGTVALHAVATNSLGILHLADGEVDAAIAAFDDARSMSETAAVLYNLSQAYARGMRLIERTAPFSAARNLDPELVSRYNAFEGKNVHQFLIQEEIPLSAYLERTMRPSPEAAELAYEVRLWTLGPGAPSWAWLAFPVVGFLGVALRRSTIRRCSRCERPVCRSCAPGDSFGGTCARCAKLFARGASSDPRMRKIQLERDRRGQRRRALSRAALSLLVPGAVRMLEGRAASGACALVLAGMGAALLVVAELVPVPFEVGGIGGLVSLWGYVLLAPAYLWTLLDARGQLRMLGKRA